MNGQLYRVARWNEIYECHRSREVKRLSWIAVPTCLTVERLLAARTDGASLCGAWHVVTLIAATGVPRGDLVDDFGRPHTAESLGIQSGIPKDVFAAALPQFLELGLLIPVKTNARRMNAVASRKNATQSRGVDTTARESPSTEQTPHHKTEQDRENTSDNCHASRESSAKTCQSEQDSPLRRTQKHTPNQRHSLRIGMAKHFGEVVGSSGELLTPEDDTLDSVLAVLGDAPLDGFLQYLKDLPATYQRGGRAAPRKWGWYISTARNFSEQRTPVATAKHCRHGKPYGTCCLNPTDFDSLTAAIELPN